MKSLTIFFIACTFFSILHSGFGGKYGRVIKNSFGKFKKPTKIYHGVRTSVSTHLDFKYGELWFQVRNFARSYFLHWTRILENRVVDQIQKSAD